MMKLDQTNNFPAKGLALEVASRPTKHDTYNVLQGDLRSYLVIIGKPAARAYQGCQLVTLPVLPEAAWIWEQLLDGSSSPQLTAGDRRSGQSTTPTQEMDLDSLKVICVIHKIYKNILYWYYDVYIIIYYGTGIYCRH